jgi:hypothetical protein
MRINSSMNEAENGKTDIYVACFHSQPGQDLRGASGQFEIVEKAIQNGEWPYDNGDDPSFFQARRQNLLTWGVCRQNVRNAIRKDDIVVFISFTKIDGRTIYRLCSAARSPMRIGAPQKHGRITL